MLDTRAQGPATYPHGTSGQDTSYALEELPQDTGGKQGWVPSHTVGKQVEVSQSRTPRQPARALATALCQAGSCGALRDGLRPQCPVDHLRRSHHPPLPESDAEAHPHSWYSFISSACHAIMGQKPCGLG